MAETEAQLAQVVLEVLRTGTQVPAELAQVVLEVLRVNGPEEPLPQMAPQPHVQVMA
jgi:hypothetical protein